MSIGAPRNGRVRRIFTIVLTIIFLSQNIAWTAPSQAPLSISYQPSANLYIPEQYGRIDKSVNCKLSTVNSKSPQVILIKDAHCVYEAQKNIENILDILIRDYGIDLVCAEGAVSKVDTSRLGSYNNQKARQKVADKYTENGLFTASEALGIKKGPNPGFDIYGVEDAKLYWKDFQAFRNTVGVSETNNRFLQLMCDLISGLKGRLYTKELKEFDNEVKRYRNNEIPLTEWIKYLRNHPPMAEVTSLPWRTGQGNQKNLRLVIQSIELEEKIDFKKVETERAALIKELENNLVKEELKELVRKSLLFKLGKLPAVDYYTYLERLGGQVEENLKKYIELVKLQSGIDEAGLFKELDLLQESIYQDLIPDEVARNLYQLDKDLNILDKVMHLKAVREDLIYYERNRDKFTPDRLLNFVKIEAPLNGIPIHNELNSPSFLKEVEQSLIPSAEFYKLALERDKVLVDNLMKRMNKAEKDKAVLVCGGFHSEGITDILKEKGINVITICPSITKTQEDSQKIYLSRMMDKRINPEGILRGLGLENLGAPIAFDTPLGDLLLKDPTEELQVLCETFGINAEGITVGELIGREVPDKGCSVKEILISRYLKGDNPLFSSFLEENVLPILSKEIREEVRTLKKMKQKLDVYLEKRHYWDAWRLIGEIRRSYPRIILEVFEKEFSEISNRIIELSGNIKESVNEKEFEKLRRCYEEIYKLDPYAFFRAFECARYARRRMEQLDEYISAQGDISSLIEHKELEERICRFIDEKRYVTVYAIVCSIVEENDVFSSLSPETCHKLLALVRIMYQEMNIGSLVDKEYSILYKVQKALVADADVISRYSNKFNKAYEERFQDIPEGLKRGRELLGKAEEGLLEKWHTTVLLKDRLKLMMHIAEEGSADELGYLKNLLALITVYFKDSYNMDLGVFFGNPQKLTPPTPQHPDFNRLIEETTDNYRKVIENLVNFDSIASSLGRESLNLFRLVVVKKDVMSVNRWERIAQLNIETKTVEKRNFYQFSRHLTHEYGHLFHFVNLPDGFSQINRQKLEDFIRKWGIDIEITDEADLGSIACEIINYLYKKKLGMWKEATDEWIRLFPDRYKDVVGRQGYKEKRKALDQGRKEFLQDRFGFKWEKYPSEPSVPALTLFHMFERSPYETMGSSVVEIEPEFKDIPYRDEDEPWEFFAEFFQLYILHPEVLRKIDEEIYDLMEIIVGNIHLEPALDGFSMDELGVKDEGGDTAITELVKKLYPQREDEGLKEYTARIAGKAALLEETGLGLLWETLRRYHKEDYVKGIFKAGIFAIFGSRLLTIILPIVLLVSGIAPYLVILIMSGWMVINSLVFAGFHENKTLGQAFRRFSAGFLFNLVASVFILPIAILPFGVFLSLFISIPLVFAGIYFAIVIHRWWDKQIRIRPGVGIFIVIGMAVLIILFSILPRKPNVEQVKSGTSLAAAGEIYPVMEVPDKGQTEISLRALYGGRMPMDNDLGEMLYKWKERKLKRELNEEEKKELDKLIQEYREKGTYNPSLQQIEDVCGKIGGLLAPIMKDFAWPGFSEEQMKILLEALLETESDDRQWIIREVDGKPIVYVLGSVKGAYGISQITRIAVQELGKVVYDDLDTISSSDPKSFAYKMAERRLKAIYLLLFADDYSFDAYNKLSINWVIAYFKTIPNEEGKGRKDFNPLIDASWNLWEYNIRASASIILTTFDYFIENYGEYKDGNYPIWRWVIAAYNWNKYGMLKACKGDKDLCILQTGELSVDTIRYQERQKELSGVSIEDEDFCKLPPLVKELVKGVYKDIADGRFGATRVIINKIDWSLRKFTKYTKKKKLDLEEVKGFLGITTVRDWNRYMKEGYTLSQILHAEIKKRERDSSAQEGRISRGNESELKVRQGLEGRGNLVDLEIADEVRKSVEDAFSEAIDMFKGIGPIAGARDLFRKYPRISIKMEALKARGISINVDGKTQEDFYCGGYVWSPKRMRHEFQLAEEIIRDAMDYDRKNGTRVYAEYIFHEALCHVLRRIYGKDGHTMARRIQEKVFGDNYRTGKPLREIIRRNIEVKVLENELEKAGALEKEGRYREVLELYAGIQRRIYKKQGFEDVKAKCREKIKEIQTLIIDRQRLLREADNDYLEGNLLEALKKYYIAANSEGILDNNEVSRAREVFLKCSAERGKEINKEGLNYEDYESWVSILDGANYKKAVSVYVGYRKSKTVDEKVLDLIDERLCLQIKRHIVTAEGLFSEGDYSGTLMQLAVVLSLLPRKKVPAHWAIPSKFERFKLSVDLEFLKNFGASDVRIIYELADNLLEKWLGEGIRKVMDKKLDDAKGIFTAINSIIMQIADFVSPRILFIVDYMIKRLDIFGGLKLPSDTPELIICANILEEREESLDIGILFNITSAEGLKRILSGIRVKTGLWEEIFGILALQPYPYLIDKDGKVKKDEYKDLLRFILDLKKQYPDFERLLESLKVSIQNYIDSFNVPTVSGIVANANNNGLELSPRERKVIADSIKGVKDIEELINGFTNESPMWEEIFGIVIEKLREFQKELRFRSEVNIDDVMKVEGIVVSKRKMSKIFQLRLRLNLVALRKNIPILNDFPTKFLEPLIDIFDRFPGELLRAIRLPEPFENKNLKKYRLGEAYVQTGRGLAVDLEKHVDWLGRVDEEELQDSVWHELIHKASFSTTSSGNPTIPMNVWREIAIAAGFIGYLSNGRFVFTEKDNSNLTQFRQIGDKNWVYQEEDELVNYVPEKRFSEIGESIGGDRYILIDDTAVAEKLKQSGCKFKEIKGKVAIKVLPDIKGEETHIKASPLEFVAYAGVGYIKDSQRARRDNLYGRIIGYLERYLFTFRTDDGRAMRYECVDGKRMCVPAEDSEGAKPLAPGFNGFSVEIRLPEIQEQRGKLPIHFKEKTFNNDVKIHLGGTDGVVIYLERKANGECLLLYEINKSLKRVPIKPGGTVTIGRGEENNIVLSDPHISGRHARISVKDDRIVIEDLNSTNGTVVEEMHKPGPDKVPGSKGIYDEDSNADLVYIAEQVKDVEGVTLDVEELEDLMKISDLRGRVAVHVIESEQLGLSRFRGAKRFHELLPALGSNGRIKGFDEKNGKFIVERDGKLHIYVTSKYHNEYLSQNIFLLAETIDHEWDENMKGMPHKKAARRARFFVRTPGGLSEYHKFVIGQLVGDGISGLAHLRGILNEKRQVPGEPSVREYEERFRKYVLEKILEEVVSEIVGVLDRRGINNISRDRVREIVVEAREAKEKVKIQELLDLAMATGAIKPEEFFDLVYEISMPLKKLFPQKVLEESREVVENVLRGILEAMGEKEAKDDTEEKVRERFFDKVREVLEQIGMTKEEIESDRELIGKALDMIELYPLIDAKKNPICFDLIKQISQMCGVTETSLVKAFSGSDYGRYEEAGNSRLSRAVGRLRLYKWIRTKGIRGVVNITDLEMRGDFRGAEGVFNGVDFMAIEASNPSDVVRYISGNAVVQEETDYIYEKLKGVVINTNGGTFGEVLNGKTPLFISIPEEVFVDIEKSDKKSITYSPGLTAFFRLMEEAKNPNVRVEIRTKNIDKLKEIINASRVSGKVTIVGEFNNEREILERQESLKEGYGVHSVFVLGKGQAEIGNRLEKEIAGNNIKVFCAEDMAPLHAVLLFSALQAAAGKMFSDKKYTDEGKNVIRSLTLFGVSDERVSEIINNNIPFFIITTKEILQQFRLQRLTIAIAA